MEPSQLGWEPLVISWINTLPKPLQGSEYRTLLLDLFHWLLPPTLRLLRKNCKVNTVFFFVLFFVKIGNNLTIQIKVTVVAPCMFTPIIFVLQEVVPTSNSNTVMSLCRLFEMLLTEPVKQNPKDRNIRTWIMVHELVFTHDLR